MNADENRLQKNIGKRIKLARYKSEYTQEQLAEKTSLSTRYISQLERGISFGSANTIISICKVLNINPNFLFNDSIEDSKLSCIDDFIDDKFLENYLKLNKNNKDVINLVVSDMVKMQNKNEVKKKV